MLMNGDSKFQKLDIEWRLKESPCLWTPTSMAAHMAEYKVHNLRWDGINVSKDVEASPDYQAKRESLSEKSFLGRGTKSLYVCQALSCQICSSLHVAVVSCEHVSCCICL